MILHLFNIDIIRILSATVIPVGNDLEITFLKKFPLIRALFGSRASIMMEYQL